ncbi:MAG: RpiB/LacA/LacB family sugar-phosphate isomerase [Clostridiales bacterium]|nr:RpiB/LacA/LacB family sugar-phosphate isomerase [Clostridiales bacterium]
MHTIAIACDPNAAEVKDFLTHFLREKGYTVSDFGSDDIIYANIAVKVAKAVAAGKYDRGILLCGTGIGMSLAANKVSGAYAALISDVYSAERARLSNDANIACLGAFTLGQKHMEKVVMTFLNNEYVPGGPSQAKVDKIREYEKENNSCIGH